MTPTELVYRIAAALQKKFKGKILGVRTEPLAKDRTLYEFTLSEGGKLQSSTAYSQGFFEDIDAKTASWLAGKIATELVQRYEWAQRGIKR